MTMQLQNKSEGRINLQIDDESDTATMQRKIENLKMSKKNTAKRIDRICRLVFPGSFFVFNAVFWSVYMH